MKHLLLAGLLCLASCLEVATAPKSDTIMIALVREDGGCALSKVAVFDDEGTQYQVEGCSNGTLTFPAGRLFGWAQYAGGPVQSFAVYILTEGNYE